MTTVSIRCPVFPSEDPDKVRDAITNIFPDAELERTDNDFRGEATLDKFSNLIRKQKILDSTRGVMFKGKKGNTTVIYLNKQVAVVGKISFTDRKTILGTIEVTIEDEELEMLIDRVAPETIDGEEVFL